MKRNVTFQSKRAQIKIDRMLALLEGRKLSARAIAEELHCDHSSVTDYLQFLMLEPKRVRIAGFEIVNGCKRALYSAGSMKNASPKRQTNRQRYAKVRNDPVKYEKKLAYDRERRRVQPDQRQRDRRVYDPPLDRQILALVGGMPGYTTAQIAERLGANLRAVTSTVRAMSKTGALRRAVHTTMKAYQWETPDRPMAAVPKVQPQHVFGALFNQPSMRAA